MRQFIFILLSILIFGCDTENAPDCFQRTGNIVTKEVEVSEFSRILVRPNIEMVIKEAANFSVVIETGDNLLEEVSATVIEGRLILENTNDCTFFRSPNQTRIFVTAPNITEIRSATQFDIISDGVLTYPSLTLLSEDFNEDEGNTTGTFTLQIDNARVFVVGNNIASFFLKGKTENLNVAFASGTGRFEGAELVAQNVDISHRGTNKIIVNPQESIRGKLRSTGDVIAVNRPGIVEVETFFTGQLILP
ncbi:head GIN domain-containing protein [Aquimarina algicola]|uniref:DUF2807 domain-containing protein n=1 Tax=Aquimarina algicola TaxID=2589995 RepID=A0A504JDW7_9FLAO|nr:head GIN domain-containing protein [Aquimarina algicola]TPN85898.1 DUF2807 domain-containing protein [Aquimarina algicola]